MVLPTRHWSASGCESFPISTAWKKLDTKSIDAHGGNLVG